MDTTVETASGVVRVIDCMPVAPDGEAEGEHRVVRLVEGVRGRVAMSTQLAIRFGYGQAVPWVHRSEGLLRAIAGPDAVALATPVPLRGRDLKTVGEFVVEEGDSVPFVLEWHASHGRVAPPGDARRLVEATRRWWREWARRCTYDGASREAVVRSLITLKALTFAPTGGVIAAPTTSLPEALGGVRNWDYRVRNSDYRYRRGPPGRPWSRWVSTVRVDRWRRLREAIHAEVCSHGLDPGCGTFVPAYDTDALDASLLVLPIVGFLPPDDPRVVATVDAVQRELCTDGLVRRYRTPDPSADGLPPRATTWASSARSTESNHGGSWATFPRRSATAA